MIELSNERIEQIMQKETPKTVELPTILRGIYTRYVCLYEKYFADIDALNDDKIAELKKYHEETKSLVKYYYMDIPQDTCKGINEFDEKYSAKLLGADWHKYVFDCYKDFRDENWGKDKSDKCLKAEFSEHILTAFYETMESVFREGFGTASKVVENVVSGLASFFFGGEKK